MKTWIGQWDKVETKNLIYNAMAKSAILRWSLMTKFARLSDTVMKTLVFINIQYI